MKNPWVQLPHRHPYLLSEDQSAIEGFNTRCHNEAFRVHPEILPEPFLGRADASALLLNLNPGFTDDDLRWHEEPEFAKQSRANLAHVAEPYPFYLLNPDLDAPGVRWWSQRLRALTDAVGLEVLARKLLCVEFFPYHSRQFGHGSLRVPSQEYGFELVRDGLRRGLPVVVMRGWRYWRDSVSELESYGRRYHLKSVQNVAISPRNCPVGFEDVVEALRE